MNLLSVALLLNFWLFLDFVGLFLSVISTSFYFGWAGVPLLVARIFLIALLSFSTPLLYRFLLWHLPPWPILKLLLGLQVALYLGLSFKPIPSLFAWGVVTGTWISGLALMALFRQFACFAHPVLPYMAMMCAILVYQGIRLSLGGLALMLTLPASGNILAWLLVWALALLSLLLPAPHRVPMPPNPPLLKRGATSYGLPLGPLIGLSLGLIFNLPIWSAQTPTWQATIYFFSLALGIWLAWELFQHQHARSWLLVLAALSLAFALVAILYLPLNLSIALAAQGLGSMGLGIFWMYYLTRYQQFAQASPTYFPWLSLQAGFLALLVILTVFLLQANPNGFWLAWLLCFLPLLLVEFQPPRLLQLPFPGQKMWRFLLFGLGSVGLIAFQFKEKPPSVNASQRHLTVMSSNIRYGWTDDYRFDPLLHLQWLTRHPVDLLGLQEVNKGHTSGAYMDLFRLYQQALPGNWYYADANYGFGNALMSRLPVEYSQTRLYQAKDMLRRSCLKSAVRLGQQRIDVFVTHLSHLPSPNPVREAQMRELLQWVQQSRRPWIVIGDFNAHPSSGEVQALLKLAHPIFRQKPELLKTPSFPSLHPQERIDYIFFSAEFQLLRQEIPDTAGSSDHRPILMELYLPEKAFRRD